MSKAPELRICLKQQQLFFEHMYYDIPSRQVLPLSAPQDPSQPQRGTGWDLLQLHHQHRQEEKALSKILHKREVGDNSCPLQIDPKASELLLKSALPCRE